MEELSKERPAEDESDTSDLDGEAYSDYETDSEIDVEDNPVHEEDSDSNSDTKCAFHDAFASETPSAGDKKMYPK
ncbi:hypothetical protein AVEN_41226-1 [Araneus ventricosus]|uniref:Uncharacterized protein n=1 Tax=Araneus ventricosus TaxID=182803 RepID=A0A4Y2QJJ5_ARAVE|nr:hypothetical protein AVEN_41226-1 [Araneus ventricosus]